MSEKDIIKNLPPLETRVLLNYEKDEEISHKHVTSTLSFNTGQYNQAVTWLESKKLIKQRFHEKRNIYSLTDTGRMYKTQGTPEERMIRLLREGEIMGELHPMILENWNIEMPCAVAEIDISQFIP